MRFYIEDVNIDSESIQEYFEKIPFVISDFPQSLLDISGLYLPGCDENWFPNWMDNINGFPLYFFIEVEDYIAKEIDSFCIQYSFKPQNFRDKFKIIEIENPEKFKLMFSLAITIACAGELVMWATHKNIFFSNNNLNNEMKVMDNQSIFVIGHDCENILILSNDSNLKNTKEMFKTFPKDIDYEGIYLNE